MPSARAQTGRLTREVPAPRRSAYYPNTSDCPMRTTPLTTTKKRILITGASRGIGRACAMTLAQNEGEALELVINYAQSQAAAEALAESVRALGASATLLPFDVSDTQAARTAIEADIAQNGAYWGLVVNAGITRDGAFPALEDEDWFRVIDVDLNGFYNVVHPAVMPMVRARRGGRIVVMSSVSGLMGNRGQVNYSAAKAGLIGAAKALATELASRAITVNCVAPGLIATEMAELRDEALEHAMAMIPMKRMGEAQEVADLVAFLLSEKAGYITRQVISINGGMF